MSASISSIARPSTDRPESYAPDFLTGDLCVPQMVAAQAAATPEALAIARLSQSIDYREFNVRANRLAHYLIELGVRRETIVALCLERSPESVICALAVLKAGGAYLPLDPAYPAERIAFMLNDAQPRVVIARNEPVCGSWSFVNLGRDRKEIERQPADLPLVEISAEQLAYVIYTSGSTGQPKGVEVTHRSLLNLIQWHKSEFNLTPLDRASHLASVGFDASVWEVWPYLASGASLHLPDEDTRLSPEGLRDWLVNEKITISFLPTALAERLMILNWPQTTVLRALLTGADTLHRYPSHELPFELVNNYGPTECTVVATSGRVRAVDRSGHLPTIGRPISNTRVYILDENLALVSAETPGELFIGGAGVARGYLNRPELNSQNFIADPFSDQPGARLYRTGDLVRSLPDGQIAYLGRIDEQIKILGYRIEPNEIVSVLDNHPAIAASAVVARGNSCEEKRLAAYLVMANGVRPASTELRNFLKQDLPDYMVPGVFVQLDALPLTANGKVDRAALPEPTAENTLRDEEFIAPRTPIEKRLAAILSSLLNLNEVSVNDNFFLLGGHSLLGTQLIAKIRGAFSVELGLRTLFDTPTIADLSKEIERLILAKVEAMSDDEARALLA
jgi:amino acid adenylation domain-containing protein